MSDFHRARLGKLRRELEGHAFAGLLVSHFPNIRYLCGFSGSAGALLIAPNTATLITDGRYRTQAAEEVVGVGVSIQRGDALVGVGRLLQASGKGRVAFEASYLSVAALKGLQTACRGICRLVGVEGLVEGLRAAKDPGESKAMRESARLASGLFEDMFPLVRPGVSELDLAAELEYRMKRAGAEGPSFETIVAFGERTAMPHARPTKRKLRKSELVLMDWGAILRGYCSDLTRTVFLGRAPSAVRGHYRAVYRAQQAAIAALRPGHITGAVDRAARRVLEKARLERYFTHSTGHGLGLEVHEEPRLARGQKGRLRAGNVVTVEPGIYVEGTGGIRIEDEVLITDNGPELLTRAPKELLQL